MKTNKTGSKPENREGQPRMTRMARIKRDFPTQNPEATRRDGARARRVRPEPHHKDTECTETGIPSPLPAPCASLAKPLRPSALFASLRLKPAPRTTRKRDFEQEATERTENQKETSLFPSLTSVQICRPFIRLMSAPESALCSLSCLLLNPIW